MISIVPVTLTDAKRFVAQHHRHHKAPVGGLFAVGLGDPLVEVTRLCSTAAVVVNASSRLYSACATAAIALGWRRIVTYTRADEPGTSLRAANWRPTAITPGAPWTSGNKATRWLPGLYVPSTEIVDRVRWEFGPDAAPELATLSRLGRRR